MVQRALQFGEELRRRRLAAGLSLTWLSEQVHYSKGQLSKVERGLKRPNHELARHCDAVLGANGALSALVPTPPARRGGQALGDDEEVWLMQLSRDGENWFRPMSRRTLLAAGATSVAGMSIGGPMPQVVDTTLLGVWRAQFDQYRRLGQVISSDLLLPTLIAQTHTLREQSAGTGQRTREELLRLTSRYAEYIGWLVQETGDDQAALWWTQRAVDLAAAGGDQDLAAYGLVRRALVSLYRNDPAQTIELARQAQQHDAPPRVLGLAAQREAQGHALAGDYDSCMRSLDNARTLLGRHASDADPLVLGTTNLRDPAAMITGWCLYDLGRPKEAAQIIGDELARIPPQAVRAHLRYGVRHALAHAAAGELEQACELTRRLLDNAVRVRSATIAVDMRALARTLSRHLTHPAVRELIPELGTALHSMTRHTNGMRTV